MKINVKENYVVVEMKGTKNPDFQVLNVGAKDYSGTMNFLVDPVELGVQLKAGDEVELDYTLEVCTRRFNRDYKEIVEKKYLNKINLVGGKK